MAIFFIIFIKNRINYINKFTHNVSHIACKVHYQYKFISATLRFIYIYIHIHNHNQPTLYLVQTSFLWPFHIQKFHQL